MAKHKEHEKHSSHHGHMKPHHKAAMHHSQKSHHDSHMMPEMGHSSVGPTGHGVSEHEGRVMGAGDFANMPQQVHMSSYPKARHYKGGVLDDTITGIDHTNAHAEGQAQKYLSNQH